MKESSLTWKSIQNVYSRFGSGATLHAEHRSPLGIPVEARRPGSWQGNLLKRMPGSALLWDEDMWQNTVSSLLASWSEEHADRGPSVLARCTTALLSEQHSAQGLAPGDQANFRWAASRGAAPPASRWSSAPADWPPPRLRAVPPTRQAQIRSEPWAASHLSTMLPYLETRELL